MRKLFNICLFMLIISAYSCSVLQQTSEIATFGRCEFRIESASNMRLASVDIQGKDAMSDLSFMDLAKIGSVIAGGTLPLTFNLNIQVKNPNPGTAAMNRLDWILIIDDVEMTRGILDQRIEIPPALILDFPVAMNLDLLESLNGKSRDALINFALNLAGSSDKPTKIKLKARPTILIGTKQIEYPGYITIRQEFGAQ